MLDLANVTGFEWDAGNERKNLDGHGVTQAEAEQIFFNEPLIVAGDLAHSSSEPHFHALGKTSVARKLHVTFTLRDKNTLIRVISARDMSRKERRIYDPEE